MRISSSSVLVLLMFAAAFAAQATVGTKAIRAADQPPAASEKKLKIVVFGAHPDDPESGAGGLILHLSRAGHDVHVAYAVMYREGRKYFGRDEKEVRREESTAACKILGATPHFFDYSAGRLYVDAATVEKISTWLDEVRPDIVVTHWPIDTHSDHNAISNLIWRSYRRQGGWNLYYFEVNAGHQTLTFQPNLYLDVSQLRETKRNALMMHQSQDPNQIWNVHHDPMQRLRGSECGVEFAEGYILVEAKAGCPLLPVTFLPMRSGSR